MATLDLSGCDRINARLLRLAHPDASPVMLSFMLIIDSDNRKGILAGLDCHGVPMRPVTYRPRPPGPMKPTAAQKNHPKKGARRGAFAGLGAHPAGLHNNLTTAEYRRLDGPPLAPRGPFSRVITNLKLRFGRTSAMSWEAVGYWDEVVNRDGKPFLHYHFTGARGGGRSRTVVLLQRDLRGVRPDGVAKAKAAGRAWMLDQVRSGG